MADTDFDLQNLADNLKATKLEDDIIDMERYIASYKELCRFFELLGSVFGFVVSDVKSKMGILTTHLNSDLKEEYKTVQKMIEYEVANNLTSGKVNGQLNGCRTLLRLHRAFEFFIIFMQRTADAQDDDKLSGLAGEAYKNTLAKYHAWMIRQAANLAMYALPTRKNLMSKIKKYDHDKAIEILREVIPAAQAVYDITQKLYEEKNILDLP
ncbi:ceramide-1-phosphate transfer protein-like [Lineus longissimus]|uniref:ceramide-1-phosphate transfer protein-like n=1 Tax=Lineus longissimus TaxID=88925 RepID=UPI00315CD763